MPPPGQQPQPQPPPPEKSLEQIVAEVADFPMEAFEFVQRGLQYTVQRIHGEEKKKAAAKGEEPKSRHVSGQELCEGLREFALLQWGMLARTVLSRWNLTKTDDFGRIVFALVDNGYMSKTAEDNPEDFKNVYDFRTAFEQEYRIECKS